MIMVDQKFTEKDRGDCMRAVIASLFELELIQVPHFALFGNDWFQIYHCFLWSLGFEFNGTGYPDKNNLAEQTRVNGGISASVPSRNLGPDITHNVIVDLDGTVIHDPHPKKNYQNINVVLSNELISWDMIEPRK